MMNGIPYEHLLVWIPRIVSIIILSTLVIMAIQITRKKIYKYVDKRLNINPKRLTGNKSKSLK